MPTLDQFQPSDLSDLFSHSAQKKARKYLPRIQNGVRQGHTLRAQVRGTSLYQVEIDVTANGVNAVCSCPYTWGGYCKHIGAVLIKWVEQRGSFTSETAVSTPPPSPTQLETFVVEPPATAVPAEMPYWLQMPYQARCQENDKLLQSWLSEYRVQDLRQMAQKQGWSLSGVRKADIVAQITSQMLKPGLALKSLLNLDAEHRQVFDALAMLYPGIAFQEQHLAALVESWGSLTKHKQLSSYVNHLCEAGFALPPSMDYWQQTAYVPHSLLRMLPPVLTDRVPATTLSESAQSAVVFGQQRPFLQRLHQILLLLEQAQPPLHQPMPRPRLEKFHEALKAWDYVPAEIAAAQKDNKFQLRSLQLTLTVPPPQPALPDAITQRLAPIAGDEAQLNFIYHLLLEVGLLQPGSPVTVWREVKEKFLRQGEAAQWATLVWAYITLDHWSELWLMLAERPSLQVNRFTISYQPLSPQLFYQMLAVFRGQVLHLLASLPDNRWFSPDEITNILHPFWPRFDSLAWSPTTFYRQEMQPHWYLTENGRTLDTSKNKADWHMAQGAFLRHIIQGPLHWLGLADLSFENGRLVAFRLHGLNELFFDKVESIPLTGAAELGAATAVAPAAPADAITIQEMMIVVDPTAVSAQTHNFLDSIAVLQKADAARFVYQLHATAVHQAFEAGQTLSQILEGWQKWLNVPIPKTIERQLTAWWETYGQVRLYENVTVIEFGDSYALTEMKAATSLAKHLIAEISPSLVIIRASAVNTLVAELEKAGYTPKQTDSVE